MLKRLFAICLAFLLILSFAGCAVLFPPSGTETGVDSMTDSSADSATVPETDPATDPETVPERDDEGFYTVNDRVEVNAAALKVRQAPDLNSEILGHVASGDILTRTGYNGTWCRVIFGSKTGYVSAKYVTVLSDASGTETGTASVTEPATDPMTEPSTGPVRWGQTEYLPDSWVNTVVDVGKTEYSYEEMTADLGLLAERYPLYFRFDSIGSSLDGRPIYAATLGDPDAPMQLVVTAGIHAREYISCLLVMAETEFYLDNYTVGSVGGKSFFELFSECAVVIVPMVNPDGVTLAQKGIDSVIHPDVRAQLLKVYESDRAMGLTGPSSSMDGYFRTWKANLAGVDLNRNYGTPDWESYAKGSRPCMSNFKGYAPGSEPETKALLALMKSLTNPVASLCMHSQGEVIYWNCGQTGKLAEQSLALAETVSGENGYRLMMTENHDASFSDWCVMNCGIPAVTVEIGDGKGSSLVPVSQIHSILTENRFLWTGTVLTLCY